MDIELLYWVSAFYYALRSSIQCYRWKRHSNTCWLWTIGSFIIVALLMPLLLVADFMYEWEKGGKPSK